ncbi:helicase-related protein, partial [Roseateles sp. GG27B]
ATSTLELGIDVGDLDRVIQIDSPSTVSSFLQRMGRTGRRSGSLRNCLFLTTNQDAFMLALGVTQLWSQAWVEAA